MIPSYSILKLAPNAIEFCDFAPSMVSTQLPFAHPWLELQEYSGWRPNRLCHHRSFESIEEEEEEEQHDAIAKQDVPEGSIAVSSAQSQSNSSAGAGTSVGVIAGVGAGTCGGAMRNRQIMKYMCSSALMLLSITALLLLLPLVLPPLPPPPSELMLLPVAILLLLVCAALSPRSSSLPATSATSASPQNIPLLPLAHSLPLRSSMPC